MEPTTFGFSKFVAWSGTLLFTGMLAFNVYMGISYVHNITGLLYLSLPLLLVLGALIAFVKWCFVPMLQGRITLELDDEKAQCYLSGLTIYWKDVIEISADYGRYYSCITFQMVDGSNDLTISTKWIEGSTASICNKMQEYFAQTI
ncbi:MAG: hypothetical protein ACXVJD_01305 [Mucilaginibacter sp.]